jgi:hypothetical protein
VVRRLLVALAAAAAALPSSALGQVPCPPTESTCPAWTARHAGAAGLHDQGFDVAYAPGVVVVTGVTSTTSGGPDVVTIAYDAATGAEEWVARHDGPEHLADGGTAVAISGDVVVVAGNSAVESGRSAFLTLAYRLSTGAPLWTKRYVTAHEGRATGVALTADRAYVTGYTASRMGTELAVAEYDMTTAAYDLRSGAEQWVSTYQGPAEFWDIAYDVVVAPTSAGDRVVVTGRSNGASSANASADMVTVAYDAAGAQQWVGRYDGAGGPDLAYGVAAAPDGSRVFVTGDSAGNGTESDYATVAYDTLTGAQRWVTRYAGPSLDLALDVAVSPAGDRVAVTGFSVNPVAGIGVPPVRDAVTFLYDSATGAEVWTARHGEPDGAAATAVTFAPDGATLFAAGLVNGNVVALGAQGVGGQVGHAPALTVAYGAGSGEELWSAHYLGPAGDEGASAVAVSPDGSRVVITGGGQGQEADVATLSYATGDESEPVVPEVRWAVLLPLAAAVLFLAARGRRRLRSR